MLLNRRPCVTILLALSLSITTLAGQDSYYIIPSDDIQATHPIQEPDLTYLQEELSSLLITLKTQKNKSNQVVTEEEKFHQGHTSQGHFYQASIFNNQINGWIANENRQYFFSANENGQINLIHKPIVRSWQCHQLSHKENDSFKNTRRFKVNQNDTVSIFLVGDFALFKKFNKNESAGTSYIHQLFQQVQAIYARDGINIKLKGSKVWTTLDPFETTSPEDALLSFREHMNHHTEADLYHLLSGNQNLDGGISFLNGLCNSNKGFGYSNIDGFFIENGSYSWDIHILAHELGHNLGSQHTHDCVWGPNGDEAIDACGDPSPLCEDAPIPTQGGTIMSYCHTTPYGINFIHGFGEEPSQRIKETIGLCATSSGTICSKPIVIDQPGQFQIESIVQGNGATHNDANHAIWYRYIAQQDGALSVSSCNQNADTRLHIYKGNCQSLSLLQSSDDDCFSAEGYFFASQIIDLEILEGDTIYIEWDDRWSTTSFSFDVEVTNAHNVCNFDNSIPNVIHGTHEFLIDSITYDGNIMENAEVNLQYKESINISPGFEIQANATLSINQNDCQR